MFFVYLLDFGDLEVMYVFYGFLIYGVEVDDKDIVVFVFLCFDLIVIMLKWRKKIKNWFNFIF